MVEGMSLAFFVCVSRVWGGKTENAFGVGPTPLQRSMRLTLFVTQPRSKIKRCTQPTAKEKLHANCTFFSELLLLDGQKQKEKKYDVLRKRLIPASHGGADPLCMAEYCVDGVKAFADQTKQWVTHPLAVFIRQVVNKAVQATG